MRAETTTPETTTPVTLETRTPATPTPGAGRPEATFHEDPQPFATFGETAHGDPLDRRAAGRPGATLGDFAGAFGKGLAAGLVGTAVMTAVQAVEMKITGREASAAPARAVEKIFGIEPRDERAERRLAQLVHFAYGTAWGGVRGVIDRAGLGPVAGPLAHFAAVWGAAAAMLPALDLAPPPSEWSKGEVATDALHHAVYAAATSATWAWLDS